MLHITQGQNTSMFAIIGSKMLWRTVWCRLSRLSQAEIC